LRKKWRTRLQPIRTLVSIDMEFSLIDYMEIPLYQKYSDKIGLLRRLGMYKAEICRRLGVSQSVVDDALSWNSLN
jgi:hypothetical protein